MQNSKEKLCVSMGNYSFLLKLDCFSATPNYKKFGPFSRSFFDLLAPGFPGSTHFFRPLLCFERRNFGPLATLVFVINCNLLLKP
jgi:hypothetical protein